MKKVILLSLLVLSLGACTVYAEVEKSTTEHFGEDIGHIGSDIKSIVHYSADKAQEGWQWARPKLEYGASQAKEGLKSTWQEVNRQYVKAKPHVASALNAAASEVKRAGEWTWGAIKALKPSGVEEREAENEVEV